MTKGKRETWYESHFVEPWPLPPSHRNNDPQTSAEADSQVTENGDRASLMKKCLWHIQDNPNQTAGEISEALGLNSWQVSKRLSDLKNQGLISPSGEKLYENHKQQTWIEVQYTLP